MVFTARWEPPMAENPRRCHKTDQFVERCGASFSGPCLAVIDKIVRKGIISVIVAYKLERRLDLTTLL